VNATDELKRYQELMGKDAADRQAWLAKWTRRCCGVRKDQAHERGCEVGRRYGVYTRRDRILS
jgi:hypothetical protein